jgi:hypothetical protein
MRFFISPRFIQALVEQWLEQAAKQESYAQGIGAICRLRKCTEAEAQALVRFIKVPPMDIAEFIAINNRLPLVHEVQFLRAAGMDLYNTLYDRGVSLASRDLFNNCLHDECRLKNNYKL